MYVCVWPGRRRADAAAADFHERIAADVTAVKRELEFGLSGLAGAADQKPVAAALKRAALAINTADQMVEATAKTGEAIAKARRKIPKYQTGR